jgi:DNA-binding beta-propeller fold protein YncE
MDLAFNLFGFSFCGGDGCQEKEADRSLPMNKKAFVVMMLTSVVVLFAGFFSAQPVRAELSVVSTMYLPNNYASGFAFDFGKGEMFAGSGGDNVSVISDSNNSVIAQTYVGNAPHGIAYDSGRNEIFVANLDSGTVSVVSDTDDSVVATIDVPGYVPPIGNEWGGPIYLAYDSGRSEIFVGCLGQYLNGPANVCVISDASNSIVATVPVGGSVNGLAYDSGKGEVFVSNGGSVSVISDLDNLVVSSGEVSVGNVASSPGDIAYNFVVGGQGEVFVAVPDSKSILVMSDSGNAIVQTISLSAAPAYLACDCASQTLFVGSNAPNYGLAGYYGAATVSAISDNGTLLSTVPLKASMIYGMGYDFEKGEIFVSSPPMGLVSIVSVSSLTSASVNQTASASPSPSPTLTPSLTPASALTPTPSTTRRPALSPSSTVTPSLSMPELTVWLAIPVFLAAATIVVAVNKTKKRGLHL